MRPSVTRVSVPGKLILMGEHAAVYGRTALVASLGLRMALRLEPVRAPGVEITLPDLGVHESLDWEEVREIASRARRLWQQYADEPTPARFCELRHERARDLVAIALGEVIAAIGDRPEDRGHPCVGLKLAIESRIPVGSGFGSSAAAAVGIVAGYLATRRLEHGWSVVDPIALEVERRQHGFPSGVDSATVYHGGVLWCRRAEDGLRFEPLAARPDLLRGLHVFHTGEPAESTGAVVAEVRARRDRDPVAFEQVLERMDDATRALQGVLTDPEARPDELLEPVRRYHRALVDIGVVPPAVRRLIEAVESAGGAAKISGAGSLGGPGAGSLIVVHPEPGSLPDLAGLERHDVPLAVEGVRVESRA